MKKTPTQRAKEWAAKNPERVRENRRKWAAKNRQKLKEYLNNYNIENREHLNALKKQYAKENSEQRRLTTADYRSRVKSSRVHFIREILRTAKTNARKRNMVFEITYDFVDSKIIFQKEKCALTGIIFSYNPDESSRCRAHAPSIDRIDNKKGYTEENVQIVCCMVNRAKNEYSQQMFDHMCRARMDKLNGS